MAEALSPIVERMRALCTEYAANSADFQFTPFYRDPRTPAEDAAAEFRFCGIEVAFLYNSRVGRIKSVLECRVGLTGGNERIDFSLYDLLYLLDENDYNCYIFAYIENPERMEACLTYLMRAVDRYRQRLEAIAAESSVTLKAKALRQKEMERFFKQNIFEELPADTDSPLLEWKLRSYREWYIQRFCSSWYTCFLRGDYQRAAAKFASYDNKSNYELRLFRFIKTLSSGASYTAIRPECDTYSCRRTARSPGAVLRYLLCAVGVTVPFAAAYALYVTMLRLMLYHGTLAATPMWNPLTGSMILLSSVASAAVCTYFIYRRVLPKKLRAQIEREGGVSGTHTDRRIMRSAARMVTVLSLLLLAVTAKTGIAYYPDGIRDNLSLFSSRTALYSQVTEIYQVQDTGRFYLRFGDNAIYACPESIVREHALGSADTPIIPIENAERLRALIEVQ